MNSLAIIVESLLRLWYAAVFDNSTSACLKSKVSKEMKQLFMTKPFFAQSHTSDGCSFIFEKELERKKQFIQSAQKPGEKMQTPNIRSSLVQLTNVRKSRMSSRTCIFFYLTVRNTVFL